MAEPSLIERLRRNSGWRNQSMQCVTDPALLTEAASTLEDQARLIGECREVVKRLLAIITPGQGLKFRDEVIDASLLLTKLNAFERAR